MSKLYVSFNVTDQERYDISRIKMRLIVISVSLNSTISEERLTEAEMDVCACHCNGCPLRLADMAEADEFNLLHDVVGIRDNIDRTTGKLHNFFSPRFAVPVASLVNPWGNERDGYAVGVEEKMQAIRGSSRDRLHKLLAWPDNNTTVDKAIRRALAKIERNEAQS